MVVPETEIDLETIQQQDLILTTVKSWRKMIDKEYDWLENSTVVLNYFHKKAEHLMFCFFIVLKSSLILVILGKLLRRTSL